MKANLTAGLRTGLAHANSRSEAMCVALAAAEVCWAAPVFLAIIRPAAPHPPLLLWPAMLGLLLGFFYFYRAVVSVNLSVRVQQGLLVTALLLSIVLFFRFHIYAGVGLRGIDWLLRPLRGFVDLTAMIPVEFVSIMTLIHLWARGIHLGRRSLSAESVGFSFRSGVVLLVLFALGVGLFSGLDISGFVVAFFFFGLIAVALARLEEISRAPNSSQVQFSGFWIGSTVGAVVLLVALGAVLAAVFYGGGLEQVLRWLSPLLVVLQVLLIGLALLIVGLIQLLVSLVPINWGAAGERFRRMFQELQGLAGLTTPFAEDQSQTPAVALGTIQAIVMATIILGMIGLVVLFTWWRVSRDRRRGTSESRESLLSARAVARSLLSTLRSGRERLGELADLVERYGLGSRLLSALSTRRIYASLVRLATRAGYPRLRSQTPHEYLEVLREALPGSQTDVAAITQAYVNAHYGEAPDSREELQRIRECWERVQARGIERR